MLALHALPVHSSAVLVVRQLTVRSHCEYLFRPSWLALSPAAAAAAVGRDAFMKGLHSLEDKRLTYFKAHLLLLLRHSTFQVVKHLWAYIKEKGLQDPKDGRRIILDDKLSTIFPGTSVNMFKMNKHLSKHCKTEGERWLCCIVSWSLHYVT